MAVEDRPYHIVAIKDNGERETIADGYEAKGWAFASATKLAVDIRVHGNPSKVKRLELENVRNEPLENYNDSSMLVVEKTMKTAVIWNEFDTIKYLVVDGDWSRFEGVFINSVDNEELQNELSALVYDSDYQFAIPEVTKQEFANAIRDGAEIVECGFIP